MVKDLVYLDIAIGQLGSLVRLVSCVTRVSLPNRFEVDAHGLTLGKLAKLVMSF